MSYIFIFINSSRPLNHVLFEVDGTGEAIELFTAYPTYPNQQFHVGGLPEGNVKRAAVARLNKNGVFVEDEFYGCLKEMTIETTDNYNNYEVRVNFE